MALVSNVVRFLYKCYTRDRLSSLPSVSRKAINTKQSPPHSVSFLVGFININDMYYNDVGKEGMRVYEPYEVK